MPQRFLLCALALTLALAIPAPAQAQQGDSRGLNVRVLRDPRIEGRRVAMVMSDWLYCYPPTRELILVPWGYVTDFASIPPAAQALISPYGDNIEGAVVHDWLFAVGEPGGFDQANNVFRYALMESGVDLVRRNAMHGMVQTLGRAAYGRPGEWAQRFGNRETAAFPVPPRFARRQSAIVGRIDGSCREMDNPQVRAALYARYRSDDWRR